MAHWATVTSLLLLRNHPYIGRDTVAASWGEESEVCKRNHKKGHKEDTPRNTWGRQTRTDVNFITMMSRVNKNKQNCKTGIQSHMDQGQLDLVKGHQWAMDATFCTAAAGQSSSVLLQGCWGALPSLCHGEALPGQLNALQTYLKACAPVSTFKILRMRQMQTESLHTSFQ